MSKRGAEKQLTDRNYDDEEDEVDPLQPFQRASKEKLAGRVIKPLKGRGGKFNVGGNTPAPMIVPSAPKTDDHVAKIQDFANRAHGLNKSFIQKLTSCSDANVGIDLSKLCEDYLKFRKDMNTHNAASPTLNSNSFKAEPTKTATTFGSKEPSTQSTFSFNTPAPSNPVPTFGVPKVNNTAINPEEEPEKPKAPLFGTTEGSKFGSFSSGFNSSSNNTSAKQELSIAPAKDVPSLDSTAPKPISFSFGTPAAKATPSFSFGAPPVDSKPAATFSFDQAKTSSQTTFNTLATTQPPSTLPASSIAAKTNSAPSTTLFSFGQSTKSDEKISPTVTTTAFSFGQKASSPSIAPSTFSFDKAGPTPAATPVSTPAFSFGGAATSTGFSFAQPANPAEAVSAKTEEAPKPFSFTSSATTSNPPSTPTFSFGGAATPTFNLQNTFQFAKPASTPAEAEPEGEEAMPVLEQVGNSLMKGEGEEHEETLFEVKAKLYQQTKKDGKLQWDLIGVGILRVNCNEGVTRLLCRADTSGRVLLNTRVYKEMPVVKNAEKQFIVSVSLDGEMKNVLVRVGQVADCEKLIEVLKHAKET